ncbi:MAG: CoA-binding protein [Anaerolineales bacterium]
MLTDPELRDLLTHCRTIAIVGYSDKPYRASYEIGRYLRAAGYHVYAVNPNVSVIDGQPVYPSLADLPEPIEVVNVFRRPEFLPQVVDEAVAIRARALWAQLGVTHPQAEARARAAGLLIVMDRCIKIDHQRLCGGIRHA